MNRARYILQSKPLDDRYRGSQLPLYNEGSFSPIYAQDSFNRFPKGKLLRDHEGEPVVQWIGGKYPSGHTEIYDPQPADAWREETLPISLKEADKLIAERSARVSTTNAEPNFLYRIKEFKGSYLQRAQE